MSLVAAVEAAAGAANEDRAVPPAGWTCFHCDQSFTTVAAARLHFGDTEADKTGCQMGGVDGQENPLLPELRAARAELTRLREEIEHETRSTAAYYARLKSDLQAHAPFITCRSIRDVFNLYDSMEGRALAAEETARANGGLMV